MTCNDGYFTSIDALQWSTASCNSPTKQNASARLSSTCKYHIIYSHWCSQLVKLTKPENQEDIFCRFSNQSLIPCAGSLAISTANYLTTNSIWIPMTLIFNVHCLESSLINYYPSKGHSLLYSKILLLQHLLAASVMHTNVSCTLCHMYIFIVLPCMVDGGYRHPVWKNTYHHSVTLVNTSICND